MKKFTFLIAILLFNFGYAQTLPIDFSDPIHLFSGGDNATTSIVQEDNGNDVLQIVGSGQAWDNAQINFAQNIDLSDDSNNTITFRIKAVNGTGSGNHVLKFEEGTTGNVEEAFTLTGTEWTDVSIDFAAGLGNYQRMVLFTDFGDGNSSVDTYLVDDFAGASHIVPLEPVNLPFDFSNPNQLMTGGDGATTSIVQEDNGNDVLQVVGAGGNWDNAQINFKENIDLSDDSNNTITFRIKAVNGTGGGTHALKFEDGTTADTELQFTITGTDWTDISLDFPAGLGNYGRIVIFTDFGVEGISDTYLIDDIAGATHLDGPPDLPSLPFDFSNPNQLMVGAEGAVVSIEQDNGNDVLQMIGSGADWDNAQVTFAESLDMSDDANNTITFKVKALNGTGSGNHLLKFETTGGGNTELPFNTTGTDWEDITLDFGSGLGSYAKMVLFTDAGGDLGGGLSDTYWFDDIAIGGNTPPPPTGNSVSVASSDSWSGYVNAFNVSDNGYAFGFSYTLSDLRATATATSMTLEPNIAIWTAEASNSAWFDQGATTQTALLYIEASSYIEDNTLAGSDLTFTGNVSVSDLGSEYTPVAFVKALDPNNGFATVVNNTADISSTGDFTVSATAAELTAGFTIQYGFSVTGPLADPADTTLGSVVIGESTAGVEDANITNISLYPNPSNTVWNFKASNAITSIEVYNLLGKRVASQSNNSNDATISTQGLTNGIYIARVTTELGTKSVKLIKY